MREKIFPTDFAMLVCSHATQHATKSSFNSGGELIVWLCRGDAIDEGALLVAIGEGKIIREAAVGCESSGAGNGIRRILPSPGLSTRDLDRTRIGNCCSAKGAKEFETGIKAAILAKLGRREGEVDVSRIREVNLVVVPAIAGVGQNASTSGAGGLQRTSAENPVAEIDDVDVLFHEDVP